MNFSLNNISNKAEQSSMLMLPTCKGIEIINSNSIVRIEASSNYSKLIFTNGRTLVVAKVLHWFEKQAGMDMFLRTHRTHLVNKIFISSYINGVGGQICLHNGELIDVSKRKKSFFLDSWRAA
jgi:two-component system, LytTR family, response regulator